MTAKHLQCQTLATPTALSCSVVVDSVDLDVSLALQAPRRCTSRAQPFAAEHVCSGVNSLTQTQRSQVHHGRHPQFCCVKEGIRDSSKVLS